MPKLLKSPSFNTLDGKFDELFELSYKHRGKNRSSISWQMQVFIDDMSKCLVDHSRYLYSQIDIRDFTQKEISNAPNIRSMHNYGDNLLHLVAATIVQQENPSKRSFNYEMWIQIMNHCYLKGDLASAFSIHNGLQTYYVERSVNLNSLSKESTSILKHLTPIFDEAIKRGTLKLHQELESQRKTPIIPIVSAGFPTSIIFGFEEVFGPIKKEYNEIKKSIEETSAQITKKEAEITRIIDTLEHMKRDIPSYRSDVQYKYMRQTLALLQEECEVLNKKYRTELSRYEELLERSDGYIPENFQDLSCMMPTFDFLAKTIQSNKMICKKEPFEQQAFLNEMLTEVGGVVKEDPDSLEKHAKEHCESGSSKAIKAFSRELSKLFSTIKSPSVVMVPSQKDKSREPVREPKKLDGLDFNSLSDGLNRCQNLLKTVEDTVEMFRPRPQLRRSRHVFFHIEKESNTDRLIINSQPTASPSA